MRGEHERCSCICVAAPLHSSLHPFTVAIPHRSDRPLTRRSSRLSVCIRFALPAVCRPVVPCPLLPAARALLRSAPSSILPPPAAVVLVPRADARRPRAARAATHHATDVVGARAPRPVAVHARGVQVRMTRTHSYRHGPDRMRHERLRLDGDGQRAISDRWTNGGIRCHAAPHVPIMQIECASLRRTTLAISTMAALLLLSERPPRPRRCC